MNTEVKMDIDDCRPSKSENFGSHSGTRMEMEPTQITPCNKSPTSESAWGTQNRFSQLRNARVAVSEEEVMDMSINQW